MHINKSERPIIVSRLRFSLLERFVKGDDMIKINNMRMIRLIHCYLITILSEEVDSVLRSLLEFGATISGIANRFSVQPIWQQRRQVQTVPNSFCTRRDNQSKYEPGYLGVLAFHWKPRTLKRHDPPTV